MLHINVEGVFGLNCILCVIILMYPVFHTYALSLCVICYIDKNVHLSDEMNDIWPMITTTICLKVKSRLYSEWGI